MEKKKYIALVIKTEGLEYDDRVRKEILTIQKLFPNISFKIFAMLPENKETEGVTGYGIPYKTVYVPSRDKYPSGRKALLKSYEFYKVIKDDLNDYDAIWCANTDTSIAVLLATKTHLLWDLHELPNRFIETWCRRMVLRYLFSRCKVVVHANPQRCDYLKEIGAIDNKAKHYVIRNYPNFEDIDTEYNDLYYEFMKWKGNRPCVYLQGLQGTDRAAYESIMAVLRENDLTAVVVGTVNQASKQKIITEVGSDEVNSRIFFAGKIPQLKIPQYVKECMMTLVFYKNTEPNNVFCEANRFYQSVIMGLPVVTGCNPSMKELIDKYHFGVATGDYGENIDSIVDAIHEIRSNYNYFKDNNLKYRNKLLWSQQEPNIKEIITSLFS